MVLRFGMELGGEVVDLLKKEEKSLRLRSHRAVMHLSCNKIIQKVNGSLILNNKCCSKCFPSPFAFSLLLASSSPILLTNSHPMDVAAMKGAIHHIVSRAA